MHLNQLIHWRTSGTPDVFTETRDGHEWLVIDSDKAYTAGFSQVVYFDKPIKTASLSVVASFYTVGGGLKLRLGMHPSGLSPLWSGWHGLDNGWPGEPAQVLRLVARDLNAYSLNVFLEGQAPQAPRWPAKNICRWRDVQLNVEYADVEPEPEPEPPEPEPDFPAGDPRRWAVERMREIQQKIVELNETSMTLLEEIHDLAAILGLTEEERARAQAWVDEYNHNRGD